MSWGEYITTGFTAEGKEWRIKILRKNYVGTVFNIRVGDVCEIEHTPEREDIFNTYFTSRWRFSLVPVNTTQRGLINLIFANQEVAYIAQLLDDNNDIIYQGKVMQDLGEYPNAPTPHQYLITVTDGLNALRGIDAVRNSRANELIVSSINKYYDDFPNLVNFLFANKSFDEKADPYLETDESLNGLYVPFQNFIVRTDNQGNQYTTDTFTALQSFLSTMGSRILYEDNKFYISQLYYLFTKAIVLEPTIYRAQDKNTLPIPGYNLGTLVEVNEFETINASKVEASGMFTYQPAVREIRQKFEDLNTNEIGRATGNLVRGASSQMAVFTNYLVNDRVSISGVMHVAFTIPTFDQSQPSILQNIRLIIAIKNGSSYWSASSNQWVSTPTATILAGAQQVTKGEIFLNFGAGRAFPFNVEIDKNFPNPSSPIQVGFSLFDPDWFNFVNDGSPNISRYNVEGSADVRLTLINESAVQTVGEFDIITENQGSSSSFVVDLPKLPFNEFNRTRNARLGITVWDKSIGAARISTPDWRNQNISTPQELKLGELTHDLYLQLVQTPYRKLDISIREYHPMQKILTYQNATWTWIRRIYDLRKNRCTGTLLELKLGNGSRDRRTLILAAQNNPSTLGLNVNNLLAAINLGVVSDPIEPGDVVQINFSAEGRLSSPIEGGSVLVIIDPITGNTQDVVVNNFNPDNGEIDITSTTFLEGFPEGSLILRR